MDDSERDMREERFTMLLESLQLLAMPAAAQLAFFPRGGSRPRSSWPTTSSGPTGWSWTTIREV